jgi:hypothetical protein
MMCPPKCGDDDNREALSALIKDVSDGNLKRLRAKTVRKILADVRGMFFCGDSGFRREERKRESL